MGNAPEFVPSFLVNKQPDPPPEPSVSTSGETQTPEEEALPVLNNDAADSWEEAADANTPSPSKESPPAPSTPDEDDEEDDEDDSEKSRKKKEPVNVIFIGHVDAGKSTIGGQIMFLTGMVDKR